MYTHMYMHCLACTQKCQVRAVRALRTYGMSVARAGRERARMERAVASRPGSACWRRLACMPGGANLVNKVLNVTLKHLLT